MNDERATSGTEPTAESLLNDADAALRAFDAERASGLARQVLASGQLNDQETAKAHRIEALALIALKRADEAVTSFAEHDVNQGEDWALLAAARAAGLHPLRARRAAREAVRLGVLPTRMRGLLAASYHQRVGRALMIGGGVAVLVSVAFAGAARAWLVVLGSLMWLVAADLDLIGGRVGRGVFLIGGAVVVCLSTFLGLGGVD